MEPSGRKWEGAENGSDKRKPLPSVATGCLSRSMVRRGSTVRVRQRALQNLCSLAFLSQVGLLVDKRASVWRSVWSFQS
jgi:hypothetical protein